MENKKCAACLKVKGVSEFGINSRYKDKLSPKCKICIKNKVRNEMKEGLPNCYIYRHIKPNGEVFYIGIGSGDNNYKRAYAKIGRNKKWKKIVKEFGYEVEILKSSLSRKLAEELEILLIDFYKREDCCDGVLCNLSDGGRGNTGLKHSEATKYKMSKDRKGKRAGKNSPMFGKKLTKEQKEKISKANKGRTWTEEHRKKYIKSRTGVPISEEHKEKLRGPRPHLTGENHHNWGKPLSEETKRKLSEAHMGKTGLVGEDNPMFGRIGDLNPMFGKTHSDEIKKKIKELKQKKVINVETLEVFASANEAGFTINMKGSTLQPYLRGGYCTYLPFMYLEDYNKGKTITLKNNKNKKSVINTETLEIYETVRAANTFFGVTSISYHLVNNTSKYPCMYLDEYIKLNPNFKK